eukprot:6485792-Amphidinium_carterae.3
MGQKGYKLWTVPLSSCSSTPQCKQPSFCKRSTSRCFYATSESCGCPHILCTFPAPAPAQASQSLRGGSVFGELNNKLQKCMVAQALLMALHCKESWLPTMVRLYLSKLLLRLVGASHTLCVHVLVLLVRTVLKVMCQGHSTWSLCTILDAERDIRIVFKIGMLSSGCCFEIV